MASFFTHPLPAVVILLGVLVFFHEFGHFVVGRLSGIAVEIFSIGFGPRLFGFTYRGTDYRLSGIPLGGYVKFAGAHPAEDVPEGLPGIAFRDASLPRRALTILAGPLANFLLAVIVYSVLGMDGISHPPPSIGEVIEGSAAEAAGIKPGDRIAQIGETPVVTWRDIESTISQAPGKRLDVVVERDGKRVPLVLTPAEIKTQDGAGRAVTIGRAGIALGRLPAMFAVIEDGALRRAGVATGERVVGLKVGAETSVTIASMTELLHKLTAAAKTEDAVTLTIEAAHPPRDDDESLSGSGEKKAKPVPVTREVGLSLKTLKTLPEPFSKKATLAALGVADAQLTVGNATDGAKASLSPGDVLLAWNGRPLRDLYALREELIANTEPKAKLDIARGLERQAVEIDLKPVEVQKPEGKATIYQLTVLFWGQPEEPPPIIEKYDGLVAAVGYGLRETKAQTKELFRNVMSLISGDIPLKALGGPMLIAKVAGDSAKRGWQKFLEALALISVNLGLLNLFPIPVLDGGQLLLMGAEGLKRKPLREAAVENFQKVGFAMILALVVLATYNDLSRFWKAMLESVVGLFQ